MTALRGRQAAGLIMKTLSTGGEISFCTKRRCDFLSRWTRMPAAFLNETSQQLPRTTDENGNLFFHAVSVDFLMHRPLIQFRRCAH